MLPPFHSYREIIPDYERFVDALQHPLPTHLRVNLLKTEIAPVLRKMRSIGMRLVPVTERDPSLFLAENSTLKGNLLDHVIGNVHFQALTSCLASLILAPAPESSVLDLCASPGGKCSHIAQLMKNTGLIVANEPDAGRQVALSYNLARLGVLNTVVTRYQAQDFPQRIGFDYILADVPCSGEGRFRVPGKPMGYGDSSWAKKVRNLQRKVISRAFDLLRPGGVMVYSTCTYNPLENEAIVAALLKERRDARLLPIECGFPYSPGVLKWDEEVYESEIRKAARFYPHQLDSVGFFMARIDRGE
jgi:NOL1/NOP2/sun family putative RNA methylase